MWNFSKNRMVYYKIRIDTIHFSKVEQSNSLEQLTSRLSFNHLWITQVTKPWAQISEISEIATDAIHKHTHILKPFEDSEPTGLKVDIAGISISRTMITLWSSNLGDKLFLQWQTNVTDGEGAFRSWSRLIKNPGVSQSLDLQHVGLAFLTCTHT